MLAHEARKRGMKPDLHTNGDVLKHDDRLCDEVKKIYGLVVVGLYDYKTNEELEEAQAILARQTGRRQPRVQSYRSVRSPRPQSIGIPKALVPSDPRMAMPDLTFRNGPAIGH